MSETCGHCGQPLKRKWIASGPHDGSPPYSLGLAGIGPILWYFSQQEAKRDAERLNQFEEYAATARPA